MNGSAFFAFLWLATFSLSTLAADLTPTDKVNMAILPLVATSCQATEGDPPDPFRHSSNERAGYDWWSLQPLEKPDPPATPGDRWSINEIDRFITAKLESRGLSHSPRADPRTLVRRLYVDLIGLPAPPDVIDRFAAHPSQERWEKLVAELLASSHYGERWARHWLDVARFGESHGYEYNVPRESAWPYRDWVIRSLNQDMPYTRFARMQLAGDILKPDTWGGAAAVGFLVAGVHNTVLGKNPAMKSAARHDELEEMAGTVSQAFLGLTVNCARCHDHKFDPISSREYYRFIAALDGVKHGTRTVRAPGDTKEEASELGRKRQALQERLIPLLFSRQAHLSTPANHVELKNPIDANRKRVTYHVSLKTAPSVWASPAQATSDRDGVVVRILRNDGGALATHFLRPGAWRGGRTATTYTPHTFAYTGDGSGPVRIQLSPFPLASNRFGGAVEDLTVRDPNQVIFEETFDRLRLHHEPGLQADTRHKVHYGATSATWKHLGTNAIHAVEHARGNLAIQLYSGGSNGPGIKPGTEPERKILSQIAALDRRADTLRRQATGPVFTVVPGQPGIMRIRRRGKVTDPGDAVKPGGLKAVRGLSPSLGLTLRATDSQRRRALAEWISHPSNGPFHRVIVNRIWHHHFGRGIVDSPSDLGFNGGRPSHPELLEWLAVWFRDHGHSLKNLHRYVATSATYQQSSRVLQNESHPAATRLDKENRLLWRQNPRRVDAETFRDSILEIAGALNRRPFGPGYKDVRIEKVGSAHYYFAADPIGRSFNRRTIYRWHVRGQRSALLDTFDCPDPSTTTPVRNVTTTPSQALSQWNHPFVLRMSRRFAERIGREAGADVAAQVESAWRRALGRSPDAGEARSAIALVKKHDLSLLARILFNSNESIWIE